MKFTLRDLIWATLVAALLLALGINISGHRKKTQELLAEKKRSTAAEVEAMIILEQAEKSAEVARAKAKEAQYAQRQYAEQAEHLKLQLRTAKQRLATVQHEAKYLQRQMADKKSKDKVVFGKTIKSTIDAKCIRIIAGDTIECLDENNKPFKVRFESIECPQPGEPLGDEAKKLTAHLCDGKNLTLRTTGHDQAGRTLAFVYTSSNGFNLTVELLHAGLAKHNKEHSYDKTLAGYEAKAREEKVGIWGE